VIAGAQSCFPLLAAEPLPVRRSLGEGGSAARERGALASATLTSPSKTRARNFCARPSGRLSRRRRVRSMFTPGLRGCGYSTASGRAKWPNRDPIGELGGKNLYGFAFNDPLSKADPDGRLVLVDDATLLAIAATAAVCTAATAWLNSPQGKQAMHDIAVAATSLADAVARATSEAARRCTRCLRRTKGCLPCIPPVGTIAGDPDPNPGHGQPGPHLDLLLMVQSPYPTCKCQWVRHFAPPLPGSTLPPGIVPVAPAAGGGPMP